MKIYWVKPNDKYPDPTTKKEYREGLFFKEEYVAISFVIAIQVITDGWISKDCWESRQVDLNDLDDMLQSIAGITGASEEHMRDLRDLSLQIKHKTDSSPSKGK